MGDVCLIRNTVELNSRNEDECCMLMDEYETNHIVDSSVGGLW